jgi:hypothetical protein
VRVGNDVPDLPKTIDEEVIFRGRQAPSPTTPGPPMPGCTKTPDWVYEFAGIRKTVSRWRSAPAPGAIIRSRSSKLDEHREYVEKRLSAFPELSARVLLRELQVRGYDGG